ncbi:ribonuclease E inhibitor RraB [Sediminibacterium sp.]|uniref:ribonuclease E inhibitor RraB n=1 Tax=Sediminibacterium sp. TaxID=1917865 RepID=UPI0025CBC0C5|nr:ribonuclease E inhibitor RraB [Sediminibacterium sp.]MBT9484957.1 ribonuclease E inhibitor RraB [Sediminibacterium sp.]
MSNKNHFQEVFHKLEKNGFETKSILTWSFFFYSKSKPNLQQVIAELNGFDYFTEISKIEDEFRLIATKSEILTYEKLEKRNKAFSELGEFCDVKFDGWEVSK